ncbi:MAG: cytochrome c3 family protein [Alphaproteobacteria bacterium]|nr:cytochrome c3 family protein [Alphaproteobacteria bacterium]
MRHLVLLPVAAGIFLIPTACTVAEAEKMGDPKFPLDYHPVLPQYGPNTGQIAAGRATGKALEQPIQFSHFVHASELGIDCQYCHSEARRSIHSGVPPMQACMGCHQYVKLESPEVQKIHDHWCGQPKCTVRKDEFGQPIREANAKPIPWQKVHDLPDYVHFNHSRHIAGGLNCTECHGQVQLQGQYRLEPIPGDAEGRKYRVVDEVMIREATLQMGWCLDCHRNHPSIDKNYGEAADLRRAELKDCWTCHK